MSFETLQVTLDDGVATITLHRPEQLNTLNQTMLTELTGAAKGCEQNPNVRAVIITGSGEKAFCAGADIKAMATMDYPAAENFAELGHHCMNTVESLSKPVIGMINGFALGGGMELALACDFLYVADTAQFALPEVTIGIFPGFGGTQRLAKKAGTARAMEMITSGRKISATDALLWGIVNRVVPKAELASVTNELARTIAQNAPLAVQSAKRVILKSQEMGLAAGLKFELETFPVCFVTHDCKEGLTAFVEKRKPSFQGK